MSSSRAVVSVSEVDKVDVDKGASTSVVGDRYRHYAR